MSFIWKQNTYIVFVLFEQFIKTNVFFDIESTMSKLNHLNLQFCNTQIKYMNMKK